jgi:hypothetical protein
MSVKFQEAVKNESLRQQYLDEVDFGEISHCVKSVKYLHENVEESLMHINESLMLILGLRRQKSKICVCPIAFITFETEDDFLSMLVDHEGTHAKEFYSNRIPSVRFAIADLCHSIRALLKSIYSGIFSPFSQISKNKRSPDFYSRRIAYVEYHALHAQYMAQKNGRRVLSDKLNELIVSQKKFFLEISRTERELIRK